MPKLQLQPFNSFSFLFLLPVHRGIFVSIVIIIVMPLFSFEFFVRLSNPSSVVYIFQWCWCCCSCYLCLFIDWSKHFPMSFWLKLVLNISFHHKQICTGMWMCIRCSLLLSSTQHSFWHRFDFLKQWIYDNNGFNSFPLFFFSRASYCT